MANASHFNLLNCYTEHSIKCRRVARSNGAAQILGSGVFKTRQTQCASCFESIEVPAVFQRLCYFLKPINSGTAPWAVEEGGWGYFDIAPIRHSMRELRSIYISIKSYIYTMDQKPASKQRNADVLSRQHEMGDVNACLRRQPFTSLPCFMQIEKHQIEIIWCEAKVLVIYTYLPSD